jgi:prolyl 4-hydroxylase
MSFAPPTAMDTELQTLRAAAASGGLDDRVRLALALVQRGEAEEAYALHRAAAEAGHGGAQVECARMLLYGVGTDAAPHAAVQWLERAERQGNVVAGYFLALIALGSTVLPRDGRINQRVLTAVKAGFPPALRAAAVHFGRRDHPQDQSLCVQLLQRAAQLGDGIAAQLLHARLLHGAGCPPQPVAAEDLRRRLDAAGATPLPAVSARAPVKDARYAPPPGMVALEDALQTPPLVERATSPRVSEVEGLLSADECRLLMACGAQLLRRSQTLDPETGLPAATQLRTSHDASFDPILEDLALRTVQLRIARAARMELVHAEQLIVLRYAPGEEYRPHRDYLNASSLAADRPDAGNRVRTICVYLNDVEAGGETEFPAADVRITPRAGCAVVFDNLHADGRPDADSLHAGLPVERGEKWLATLWLRERRYRDY